MKKTVPESRRTMTSDYIILYVIIIAIAFIPLFMVVKPYILNDFERENWTGVLSVIDMYNYGKSMLISLCGFILFCVLLYQGIVYKKALNKYFYILMGYGVLIILSVIFSKYIDVALLGFIDRFEGGFVLLSYITLCYSAFIIVEKNPHWLHTIITAFMIGGSIAALIGVVQFTANDALISFMTKHILLPFQTKGLQLNLAVSHTNMIYSTMFNPNYVGSYAALFFFTAVGYLFNNTKTLRSGALSLFFVICSVILLFGSLSRAGILGVLIMLPIFILLFIKQLIEYYKISLAMIISIVIVFIVMNYVSKGTVWQEFKNLSPTLNVSSDSSNTNKEEQQLPSQQTSDVKTKSRLVKFEIDKNRLIFQTETETLIVIRVGNDLQFYNNLYEPILSNKTEKKRKVLKGEEWEVFETTFTDEVYNLFSIDLSLEKDFFVFNYSDLYYPVMIKDNSFGVQYKGFTMVNRFDNPPIIGFNRNETFANGRGYIWSRTLPMFKETSLIGYGPDTFVIKFPQYDIVGKTNGLNSPQLVVDKPHNWYLQVAVSTGVLSLILLLSFLIVYAVRSIITIFRMKLANYFSYPIFIFLSIGAYCIAGVFNDSVVSVAPVFWVLLGIGMAISGYSDINEA